MKIVRVKFIAVFLTLVLMTVLSFLCKFFFKESNMEKYTTVDQLKMSNVQVDGWVAKSAVAGWEEDGIKVTAEQQLDDYYEYLTENPDVLIVEPTGNIKCTHYAILQEMEIKQTLRGDAKSGDVVQCVLQFARVETRENGVFLINSGMNLMQTGNQYLLFCKNSDMSNYSSTDYYMCDPSFTYLNLSDDNVAMSIAEDNHYSNLYSCEFFGEDEEAVAAILDFKRDLISRLKEEFSF